MRTNCTVTLAIGLTLAIAFLSQASAEEFYAGKTLDLVAGFSAEPKAKTRETIAAPADPASATTPRLKVDRKQASDRYITEPPFLDREQIEVVARSIIFPSVLYQGELMLTIEYPDGAILCLDAAYYAGRAQGLIWAMDRDTVVEHGLQWTIDNAKDLFDACLGIFAHEAVADENLNDQHQLEEVRKVLSEQIELIQEKLRYARDVKITADEDSVFNPFTRVPNNQLETDIFGVD